MALKEIYLDNSATTRVDDRVVDYIARVMRESYGNPSSLYDLGLKSHLLLEEARKDVAALIGGKGENLYFTSGGTEANNWAVFGTAHAKRRRGRHIVTTAFEHSSVLEACRRLEGEGFTVTYVRPDEHGRITPEQMLAAVTPDTILLSFMLVNNEVGTVMDYAAIAGPAKKLAPALTVHCDAVQAFGKLPLKIERTDIDLLSVSGHKIHAPKGIGALYVKKGTRIDPLIVGGSQQGGLRPGTESLPLAAGMGYAARLRGESIKEDYRTVSALHAYATEKLSALPGVTVNSPENAFPYILNISVEGLRSETLLHHLEADGIYVSSASACTGGAASHVLAAMGLPAGRIDSALRISFGGENTPADIDALTDALALGIATLARAR